MPASAQKYGLQVPLLADPSREVINAYGVWGPKKTFGREYEGLIRTTFLISAGGRIEDIWKVTRIKGHAEAVLETVQHLGELLDPPRRAFSALLTLMLQYFPHHSSACWGKGLAA